MLRRHVEMAELLTPLARQRLRSSRLLAQRPVGIRDVQPQVNSIQYLQYHLPHLLLQLLRPQPQQFTLID